jgi:hypothetical protein
VADEVDGEVADHVGERREVEYMLGDAVERARRLRAVAVPAQVERVDVEIVPQRARHPVPVARVVESAVDEQERRPPLAAPVPELQLQPVRVEKV